MVMTKRALKGAAKMPRKQQTSLNLLIQDLTAYGPVQASWPNYSKLSDTEYHCHLSYRWAVCWRTTGEVLRLEVYYAGPRGSAPY